MALGLGAVLASAGMTQVGADLLDKAAEQLFGERAKDILENVKTQLRAHTGEAPTNHDLEGAIRCAELTATLALLGQFRRRAEGENYGTRAAQPPPFIESAQRWTRHQVGLCPSLRVVPNEQIVAKLNRVLDPALAATRAADVNAALAEARDKVWTELVEGAMQPVPPDFEALFFGREDGEPGWATLFIAFLREQLKAKPRVQVAFVVTRLASVSERLRGLEALAQTIKQDTGTLIAYAEEERQKRGIAEGFIHEMAGRIAASPGLDLEGKMRAVRSAIELYSEEIAGGNSQTNLGDIVDQALVRAKSLADQGKSRLARTSLRRAAESLRRDEEERRSRYAEGVRVLYGRERDIALAVFDGEAAAEAVLALAAALHPNDLAENCLVIASEAEAAYEHGREKGSNVHLVASIALLESLVEAASERAGKASYLNDLGNALQTLGEREQGTARLEEAVTAYRAALEERTRERVPLQWAMTQNNLGTALATLGERESGTARLEQAVAAYRAALEERTRERVPLDWATTQNNLGTALATLGKRESGTARLEQAAAAYRAALEIFAEARTAYYMDGCRSNLDRALALLAERKG